MSVEAISWACRQTVGKSSIKFVLIALANYSDAQGYAWPSVAAICDTTEQDRKTVLASLSALCEAGLMIDTGQKKGGTKQVPVYQLQLQNNTKNGTVKAEHNDAAYGAARHYLYRVTNPITGQFYVGVRSCVGDPAVDRYFGSGRWPNACQFKGVSLAKEIIRECETRQKAEHAELELIEEMLHDPLCMNSPKSGTSTVFPAKKTVPKTAGNSTVFPNKQYQKRDTEPSGTVKEPSSIHIQRPPEVDEKIWRDWLLVRKAKRAPLTESAWRLMLAEIQKADWTVPRAIAHCVERNWQGFRAEYVQNQNARSNAPPRPQKFDPVEFVNRGKTNESRDPRIIEAERVA